MIFEISNKYLPGYVLEVDLAKFTGLFTGKKEEAPTGEFSAHKATPSVEAASEVRVETTKEGSAGHVLEGWSSGQSFCATEAADDDDASTLCNEEADTALWAWMVVFSKSVVLTLTRKFLLRKFAGLLPAAAQFNQIFDCCKGSGDMANLTFSALS